MQTIPKNILHGLHLSKVHHRARGKNDGGDIQAKKAYPLLHIGDLQEGLEQTFY